VEREGQADDALGTDLGRRPAGHPRAGGPPAGQQRQPGQRARPQVRRHRAPRRVELVGGRGRAPSRHPVGLLDERHADTELERGARGRPQVASGDRAARAVAEQQRRPRPAGGLQVDAGGPVRGVDVLAGHGCGASMGP
jgi:hypothetical protein